MNVQISLIAYFIIVFIPESRMQRVYRAAVVGYVPKRETYYLPHQIIMENTNQYVQIINEISSEKVHIIIFPEYGLTTMEVLPKVPAHLESYSIKIPDITHDNKPNPCCNSSKKYHKALIDISCAARTANVHVVAHFVEREGTNRSNFAFYSTNIVLNNNGNIIHKYRKINLDVEAYLQSGTQQAYYFDTSFGVTFGILMGADILYKEPTNSILSNVNVTDVIYTAAWNSLTPFLHGSSIQQGYAKSKTVNLLSACLNDKTINSSGSGVYFSNGSVGGHVVLGTRTTSYVILDVETVQKRFKNQSCQAHNTSSTRRLDEPNHIQFPTEDLKNYTTEDIRIVKNFVNDCSKINKFCCYSITSKQPQTDSEYSYKLVSFMGVRYFNRRTIGIAICAVVACESDAQTSCRLRSNYPSTFNNISVTVKFENVLYKDFRPITLNYGLFPTTDYCFQRVNSSGNSIQYYIRNTKPQTSLLTFGILGRIYHLDNTIPIVSERIAVYKTNKIENSSTKNYFSIITITITNLLLHSVL